MRGERVGTGIGLTLGAGGGGVNTGGTIGPEIVSAGITKYFHLSNTSGSYNETFCLMEFNLDVGKIFNNSMLILLYGSFCLLCKIQL